MMTQKQYHSKEGTLCPVCKSKQIEGGPATIDGNEAFQEMDCHECESEWVDYFDRAEFVIRTNGKAP